jgi:hypothetical protein
MYGGYNQSPAEAEESINPLRKYRHLIPTSCSHFTQPLTFHLFAGKLTLLPSRYQSSSLIIRVANVSILFPNEDAENFRLTVARTSDQAFNQATGETEERHLFYAVLMQLKPSDDLKGANGPTALIKGPAVPYFSPTILDPKMLAERNKVSYISLSSSSAPRNPNEDSDLREVKEKAILLLMAKMDKEVHKQMAEVGGEAVEIWEAKGWKFAPAPTKEGEENLSVKGATRGRLVGKRDSSNWLSKS